MNRSKTKNLKKEKGQKRDPQKKRQPHEGEIQIGLVKRHPDGFGFFIPEDSNLPDVYISRQQMMGVMGNDRIKVLIRRKGFSSRFYGEVLNITKRAHTKVSGKWEFLNKKIGLIKDQSNIWGEDMKVTLFPKEIQKEDWVLARVLTYPLSKEGLTGEVEKVIKDPLNPKMDVFRVLHSHSIPHEFNSKTLEEASKLPLELEEKDKKERRDLRSLCFLTIDGKTAKDFDDAIYVEKKSKDFKAYVAIADVGHYVKPGKAIDKEAFDRGNSTYFPGFVSPMLPEKLSNELCSLQPQKDRLVMTFEALVDLNGKVLKTHFYSAVIKSKARITYGEAQEIIDEQPLSNEKKTPFPLEVKEVLKTASQLAQKLMKVRKKRQALELDIPETKIEVNESGEPLDLIRTKRLFSHCMIEEFMLLANTEVAKFLASKKMSFLYRVHEPPLQEDIDQLNLFFQALGFTKKLKASSGKGKKNSLQKKLNAALKHFSESKHYPILSLLILRALSQAKYDIENGGHFGLNLKKYTHFTSPIRRYSDLSVHRLLKQVLSSSKKASQKSLSLSKESKENLKIKGPLLSACEQRSLKAERQFLAVKKARFLLKHLGDCFEGTITSVKKFGVFVALKDFDVDGLVAIEDLKGGFLKYDEKWLRLSSGSGLSYSIGDSMKIQVAETNIESGKIRFVPA